MVALLSAIAPGRPAAEDAPEPPVDVPEDADVTFERADSLADGNVEVEMGLRGLGGSLRRERSLRFRGDDLDATVREGAGDPLAGAELGGRGGAGSWRIGRVAPQWGRGWLVGSPEAPWSVAPGPAGGGFRAGPRGDVALLSIGDGLRLDGLVGHFAKRDLVALRASGRGLSATVVGHRGGLGGVGLGLSSDSVAVELAMDHRNRWRGELALGRETFGGRATLVGRAGSRAFRALLAPARSGPAEALAGGWDAPPGRLQPRARAGLWRFGEGFAGARGALEVDVGLAQHAELTLGFEEQRGTRRETTDSRGMRQGWWGEWHGGTDPVRLELRLETWGRGARARGPVRSVSGAGVEVRTPFGGRLSAEHRVYRSGRGESLRLPELESDRLVLRALSGAGEDTRIEWTLPGPAGRMRAGLSFTAAARKPARTQWTIHWARRARVGRAPP